MRNKISSSHLRANSGRPYRKSWRSLVSLSHGELLSLFLSLSPSLFIAITRLHRTTKRSSYALTNRWLVRGKRNESRIFVNRLRAPVVPSVLENGGRGPIWCGAFPTKNRAIGQSARSERGRRVVGREQWDHACASVQGPRSRALSLASRYLVLERRRNSLFTLT